MGNAAKKEADKYQEFFNFFQQEYDIILTVSEMKEIISEAQKLLEKIVHMENKSPLILQNRKDIIINEVVN